MERGFAFTRGKDVHIILLGSETDLKEMQEHLASKEGVVDPVAALAKKSSEDWRKAYHSEHKDFSLKLLVYKKAESAEEVLRQVEAVVKAIPKEAIVIVVACTQVKAIAKTSLDVLVCLKKEYQFVRRVLLTAGDSLPEKHVHASVPQIGIAVRDLSPDALEGALTDFIPMAFTFGPDRARRLSVLIQHC